MCPFPSTNSSCIPNSNKRWNSVCYMNYAKMLWVNETKLMTRFICNFTKVESIWRKRPCIFIVDVCTSIVVSTVFSFYENFTALVYLCETDEIVHSTHKHIKIRLATFLPNRLIGYNTDYRAYSTTTITTTTTTQHTHSFLSAIA